MNLGGNRTSTTQLIPVVIAGIAIIIGGFIIGTLTPSIFPVQASSEAEQVDELFRWMLIIGGAIFLLVQGMLIYSVIRFRRKPGDDEDGPTIHGNTTLELVWTAIPAVIVIFLVIYSYQVWISVHSVKDDEMAVSALGQRYVWNFTYTVSNPIFEEDFDPEANPDDNPVKAEEMLTFTDSTLHTYIGRPVVVSMETRDVNHSFWVPTMRIKQDLLAGRTTEARFTPTREGRYRIVCAELCGGGHGQMYSFIQVHADEDAFNSEFLDARVENIINPPDDPVALGADALLNGGYGCAGCHVLEDEEYGIQWGGLTGPALQNVGDTAVRRASSGAGGATSPEDYLAHSIRYPNDYLVPGYGAGLMPQFGPFAEQPDDWNAEEGAYYVAMPDRDLANIVAYLCQRSESGESVCGDQAAIEAAVEAQR